MIYHLSSEEIIRIRIGVGGEDFSQDSIAEYVLSDFSLDDEKKLSEVFKNCFTLVESFIVGGKKQLLDTNSKLAKPISNSGNNL